MVFSMKLMDEVLQTLSDHPIVKVRIGMRWTAVVAQKGGGNQCGLASTLQTAHTHDGSAAIPEAGALESVSGLEMAQWIKSEIPVRRSLGCAAINALMDYHPQAWVDDNASEAIIRRGRGKTVALIGHFPFVAQVREEVEDFYVLDLDPVGRDLPACAAPEILPTADVVAITGMTFINGTIRDLLALCQPDAYVIVLGPTTPLSPVFHKYGVDLLAGSVVEDIPAVLNVLSQGGNFTQIHQAGVRLVLQSSLKHPG
jgi:uncharacterized protein (DUF4213/DUF364 family)